MPDSTLRSSLLLEVPTNHAVVLIVFVTVGVIVGVVMAYAMIREWRVGYRETIRQLPPLVIPSNGRAIIRPPLPLRAPLPAPAAAAIIDHRSFERPAGLWGEPSPMETVRFRRPDDDALQLLPGRLEVLAGEPRHQEIRFVRIPGERPQLILGRDPGSSPQHVALQSTTVSRRHARLAFANGAWAVANLSSTNPLILNNESLGTADGERALTDGDRIELGEVVLRFHAH